MSALDTSIDRDGGFLRKVLLSLQEFVFTYRWASTLSTQAAPQISVNISPWWRFLALSTIIFIVSMVIAFVSTVQLNVLALSSSDHVASAGQFISMIGESVANVNDDIRAHRIGDDSLVVVSAMTVWFAIVCFVAAISSLRIGRWKFDSNRFHQACYAMGALTTKAAVIWLIMSLIAISIQAITHPFIRNSLDSSWGPWLFVACNVLAAVGVFGWVWWKSGGSTAERKYPNYLSVVTIILTIGMSGVLIQIASFFSDRFPPNLQVTLSPECEVGECYVYVRSSHVRRMILDSPASFQVKMNYRAKGSSNFEVIYGQANIVFERLEEGSGPAVLEPDAEQILKVKHVKLRCAQRNGSLAPVEMSGGVSVYIPNHHAGNRRRFIPITGSGFLLPLFRNAEGGCPVELA
ncbi:hypothetical protein [Cupriavidus necator]|uniref:hypothetical protein n=1 Tax=Cupriavidus necator TaxID=106590 RepID=UPI00140F8611|nr:hypothetical protein [Cupriavidus necator]